VIRQLNARLKSADERHDIGLYVRSHPERFALRLVALPAELDRADLRLALRHQDDWDHAEQIVEALGDEDLDWQRIVSLLQRQPHLRHRMEALNRADLSGTTR
jgi:spore coat polysaccharide biosynthesis protein SpsF (cytidylyltransferase family)